MFQEHLKSCGYCQNIYRATKLAELGLMIRGTSYAGPERERSKGASSAISAINNNNAAGGVNNYSRKPGYLEKTFKLKELGKLVRG